ncbi:MAG: Nitrilotriacetate monooxygenase, partial [Jatrophihabitantaceae bacterium]|nr:Nitrilotriacetate monooxygenase [Jatrophihabitantaceae bacterium]
AIDLPALADEVLPALTGAGVHRAPLAGATLRETLGLSRPISRFATLTSTGGPR